MGGDALPEIRVRVLTDIVFPQERVVSISQSRLVYGSLSCVKELDPGSALYRLSMKYIKKLLT